MSEKEIDYDEVLSSGKYLFKYCRFNVNALQILINNTLYFAHPDKLNDPLDSRFNVIIKDPHNFSDKTREKIKFSGWFLDEEITLLLKDAGLLLGDEKKIEELFQKLFCYIQNTYVGICSFSLIHSDNLLWSHYSDEARGLCFVFDKGKLLESIAVENKLRNIEIFKESVSYKGVKKLEIKLYKRDGDLSYSFNHLFSKTKHWEYEKEYRLVLGQKQKKLFSVSPNRFNPLIKFSEESLRYIMIGERMLKEHRQILCNLRDNGIIKAELLEHKFDYSPVPIIKNKAGLYCPFHCGF